MDDNAAHERSTCVRRFGERSMTDSVALLRQTLPAVLPRLRRFARTLARNVHDADDLAQIALERALLRAAQWRAPPAGATPEQTETAVRSWMFGIVKNAWIDTLACSGSAVVTGDDSMIDVADGSHSAMEAGLSMWRRWSVCRGPAACSVAGADRRPFVSEAADVMDASQHAGQPLVAGRKRWPPAAPGAYK
jgi:hypothetical protein